MSTSREIFALIQFEWKRAWFAYLGVALLLIFMGAFEWRYLSGVKQHGIIESATISAFGLADRRLSAGKVIVVASDRDGISGQATVIASQVSGCEVGDRIEAERIGSFLKLKPKPCR